MVAVFLINIEDRYNKHKHVKHKDVNLAEATQKIIWTYFIVDFSTSGKRTRRGTF